VVFDLTVSLSVIAHQHSIAHGSVPPHSTLAHLKLRCRFQSRTWPESDVAAASGETIDLYEILRNKPRHAESGGGEFGGCCINATLRDYGRIGLFALADGRYFAGLGRRRQYGCL